MVGAGSIGVGVGIVIAEANKQPLEHLIPYAIPPEEFSPGIATWYNSVCNLCSAGCGITVRTREGRAKKIEGNPSHPVNQGKLCALGQAGLQVLYNPDRIIEPMIRTGDRGAGLYAPTTWQEGLAQLADRLGTIRSTGSADRIGFISMGVRGHLGDLLAGFMAQIGSTRLLHYDFEHPQTLYAANQRFFGQTQLPYYDIENTHYLLSFGADYLGQWLSPVHHSLGFGRSRHAHDFRGQFIQIEPRMSMSGAAADEWIPANPGTEGILALGIAHHIVASGVYQGADRADWSKTLADYSIERVAEQTGISSQTIQRLAENFATNQPSLAIGGGAAGQYSNGVDTLTAVNALNYLVGNLGKKGGLVFNPEPAFGPQPQLHRADYRTMVEFAEAAREGRIEVLIINQTNPVFTLPEAAGFKAALADIPLIVSFSSFMDETTAMADLILPSHTYLESWGDDSPEPGVGFSVGAIAQPVVSPLYNTRATGDILLDLAQKLELGDAYSATSMEDYLKQRWREIYTRGANVEGDSFESFWTTILQAGVWGEKTRKASNTFVPDKRVIEKIGVAAPEFAGDSDAYPFILHPYVSNSLRDGRGANLPWLQELPDPLTGVVYGSWAELHPSTANDLGLAEGDLVEVESLQGKIMAPVLIYPAIRPDVIAMPIGQGHTEYGRYARNRGTNPMQILAPVMDSETGSLASSATRVKLRATGRRAQLIKSGGESRELGRGIVQTTGPSANHGEHSAALNNIPITVETS